MQDIALLYIYLRSTCTLGGDYMIPVCRDEISARLAGTDFTLQLHGETKFHPDKAVRFPPGICLDLYTFYLSFLHL